MQSDKDGKLSEDTLFKHEDKEASFANDKGVETEEEIAKQYKKFISAPKFNLNSEEVYCICRKPDYGEMMVLCDGCDEWFHFGCMKLNEKHAKLISRFYCKFCEWKGISKTKWKRKCRLPNCWQPCASEQKSKYCSKEHAIQFMGNILLKKERDATSISASHVKSVLEYVSNFEDSFLKLKTMGLEFPEIQDTIDVKNNGFDPSKLPSEIQYSINMLNKRLEYIQKSLALCETKSEHLLKYKEKVKLISDKITQRIADGNEDLTNGSTDEATNRKGRSKGSNKSKKFRKVDLCLYNRHIASEFEDKDKENGNLLPLGEDEVNTIVNYYIKMNEDESFDMWYENTICLQDKRKCARHNGWWNLIYDENARRHHELLSVSKRLEDERLIILKDYNIKIYETMS